MKKLYSVLFAIALALGITPANAQKISALPDAGLAQAGDLFPISNLGRSATTSFTVTATNLLQSGLPASLGVITSSSIVYGTRFVASSGTSVFPANSTGGIMFGPSGVDAGIWRQFNQSLYFGAISTGATYTSLDANGYYVRSTGSYNFSTSSTDPNASDTSLNKVSAGVVGVNINNTAGTAGSMVMAGITVGSSVTMGKTVTASGTTGARTINLPSGSVNFAAAATSLVWTNSLVTVNSIIVCTAATNDATAYVKNVVPAAGSFTITLGAAATAETRVSCIITN